LRARGPRRLIALMSSPLYERKPWPMKWIVLAIAVSIALYTFLTLHYRKPGRAYRPYEDMKTRFNTEKLLAAGYQRIELGAEAPIDLIADRNTAFPAPGGLPADLKATVISNPRLPAEILEARAPASTTAGEPYRIALRCTVPDDHRQLAGAELYLKGDRVVITPDYELLTGGLMSRSRDNIVQLTVPSGALKPGTYRVTLVGEQVSRAWTLQVK
jgi:hypothetical protein